MVSDRYITKKKPEQYWLAVTDFGIADIDINSLVTIYAKNDTSRKHSLGYRFRYTVHH